VKCTLEGKMLTIPRHERLTCPPEFQELITERFGLNRFDEPNFKIVWGQTETTTVAGMGVYEPRLLCSGVACWNILRWKAPEAFGTPESWYAENADPDNPGFSILGPYPEKGAYEVLTPLVEQKIVDGKLSVKSLPLEHVIIDTMIPLIEMAQHLSKFELMALKAEEERKENERMVNEIADRLESDLPAFYGPVSYEGQRNRTALITRKMEDVERVWRSIPDKVLRNPRRGLFQKN